MKGQPQFMMKTYLALSLATILSGPLWAEPVGKVPEDFRFQVERLVEGIAQPMGMAIAGDGRVFFNEYRGKLKVYHPETGKVTLAGELTVFADQENGFLGFALDPKFTENGWIYCLYSPKGFDGQYLSRFTIVGDVLDLASEKKLLQYEEQRQQCCHHGGTVAFAPDGCLLWSAGDNTHPHADSNGYAPLDERAGRAPWDAQKSASNTMSLAGKICRIRPKADGTYEIPEGNLFPVGTPQTRPEIYVMGCRNAWRMSVDSVTGIVYWGEVGPDANSDGPRGPRGYDEINQAKKAGNFGWPYFIGNNFAYVAYDYQTKTLGKAFDPQKPVNGSVNNLGLKALPPAMPAMLYWPYAATSEHPEFGAGGRTACAGPVFHWKPEFEKGEGFPRYFDGCLLFWDWERPMIKWARLDGDANLVGVEAFSGAMLVANKGEALTKAREESGRTGKVLIKRPLQAAFGKDGQLYLMDYGETWGANADAQLLRVKYVMGNIPPVARVREEVLVVDDRGADEASVSAEDSKDPEGGELSFEWTLQPGGGVLGKTAKVPLKIAERGNYLAEVRVTDGGGASSKGRTRLVVGNQSPKVKFEEPVDGGFYTPGEPVKYRVAVSDREDGESGVKGEAMGSRTMVSGVFQRAKGKGEVLDPGVTRMKQSDCFNCHAPEQRVVGPSLLEIADKYRNQAGALELLTKKVREGGSGVWGAVPMLPHGQLTDDEIVIMLRWVLNMKAGEKGPVFLRGLTGEMATPKTDKPGNLVIEATYTDEGRAPAGELSGRATITLRPK